jgi:hypothetical protein
VRAVNASVMASLKSTEIAKALTSAKDERRFVRLTTRYDDWGISGYVVGLERVAAIPIRDSHEV